MWEAGGLNVKVGGRWFCQFFPRDIDIGGKKEGYYILILRCKVFYRGNKIFWKTISKPSVILTRHLQQFFSGAIFLSHTWSPASRAIYPTLRDRDQWLHQEEGRLDCFSNIHLNSCSRLSAKKQNIEIIIRLRRGFPASISFSYLPHISWTQEILNIGKSFPYWGEAISDTCIELSAAPAKYANSKLTWTKFDLAHLHISTAICFPSYLEMSGHLYSYFEFQRHRDVFKPKHTFTNHNTNQKVNIFVKTTHNHSI